MGNLWIHSASIRALRPGALAPPRGPCLPPGALPPLPPPHTGVLPPHPPAPPPLSTPPRGPAWPPTPSLPPLRPCLLAALQVAVGTAHHLQAVPGAVHEELQQPVHRGEPAGTFHHRLVSAEKVQPRSEAPSQGSLPAPTPPSSLELKIGWEVGCSEGWHLL